MVKKSLALMVLLATAVAVFSLAGVSGQICTPGYMEVYRCNGDWQQKEYQNLDCSLEWRDYSHCGYDCTNGECTLGCVPGYLNQYKCNGNWQQGLYQMADCSTMWTDLEYCFEGCSNGVCASSCTPGYLDDYRCNGDWTERKYQHADCSIEWQDYEYCVNGCTDDGLCYSELPQYCIDSDGGMVWDKQGFTYGVDTGGHSFSKTDYCSGSTLYEYYCAGDDAESISYQCANGCDNGVCTSAPQCTNDCSTWGEEECDGDYLKTCGYYDADTCLDLKSTRCGGGCCDDECDEGWKKDYRCDGDWRQKKWVSEDCDTDWIDYEFCQYGCDDDRCNREDTTDNDCSPGYTNSYRCSGTWKQRQYRKADCSTEWRNYEVCSNGCSGGVCNLLPPMPQPRCGDALCNNGETCATCSQDCGQCMPTARCSDAMCNGAETCATCPSDCGPCQMTTCGDAMCNGAETCATCPSDCGSCRITQCGDALCNGAETCSTCSQDCGSCPENEGNETSNRDEASPTGGFLAGEGTWIWAIIGIVILINVVLAVILLRRVYK